MCVFVLGGLIRTQKHINILIYNLSNINLLNVIIVMRLNINISCNIAIIIN